MRKHIRFIYQNNDVKKTTTCRLTIDRRSRKSHYVLIKNFNRFMYDHSLYRGRKHFCPYCLDAVITEETLIGHIKDCFKINGKKTIKIPKKGEYVKFKNLKAKYHS